MVYSEDDLLYDQNNDMVFRVDMTKDGRMWIISVDTDQPTTMTVEQEDPEGFVEYHEAKNAPELSNIPGKLDATENYIRYMIFMTMMDVHKDNIGAATEASLDVLNRVFGVKIDFK